MTEPLFNIDVLRKQVNGDEEFVKHLIKSYIDKTPEQLNEMKIAANESNWQEVSNVAHKLKSSAKLMGMEIISNELLKLEQDGKSMQNIDTIAARATATVDSILKAIDGLKQY